MLTIDNTTCNAIVTVAAAVAFCYQQCRTLIKLLFAQAMLTTMMMMMMPIQTYQPPNG